MIDALLRLKLIVLDKKKIDAEQKLSLETHLLLRYQSFSLPITGTEKIDSSEPI